MPDDTGGRHTAGAPTTYKNQEDRILMKKMMKVEGMHCAGCSGRLKRLLEALPAVESAAADHAAGTAEVTLRGDLPDDTLKATVEKAGFTLVRVESVG